MCIMYIYMYIYIYTMYNIYIYIYIYIQCIIMMTNDNIMIQFGYKAVDSNHSMLTYF